MSVKDFVARVSLVLIVCCMLVGIYNLSPYRVVVIISESMEPLFMTNSFVLVDTSYSYDDLDIGDIIQFYTEEYRYVVHRIETVDEVSIMTKGDNNPIMDKWTVFREDYAGKVIGNLNGFEDIVTFYFGDLSNDATYDSNVARGVAGIFITLGTVAAVVIGGRDVIKRKRGNN